MTLITIEESKDQGEHPRDRSKSVDPLTTSETLGSFQVVTMLYRYPPKDDMTPESNRLPGTCTIARMAQRKVILVWACDSQPDMAVAGRRVRKAIAAQ
jgi:hypothetical protein